MMRTKAEAFIDKLPLAGKGALEPALKGYIKSNPGKEKSKFLGVNTLLGVFVVAHAYQAKMGVTAFSDQLQHLETTGDVNDVLFMGIDTAYAAVNAAVTVRQARLMQTANQIRQRRHARKDRAQARLLERAQKLDLRLSNEAPAPLRLPTQDLRFSSEAPGPVIPTQDLRSSEFAPASSDKVSKVPFYKRKIGATTLAVTVTLSGQAVMGVSWADAMFDSMDNSCIATADNEVTIHAQSNASLADQEIIRDEWVRYCDVDPSDITPIFIYPQSGEVAQQP